MFVNNFLSCFPGAAYQTFPDSANANKNIHPQKGSLLDTTEEFLQKLNKQGHGIFFSPNSMVRGYRDIKHVEKVNAFFVDLDDGTKAEQFARIIAAPITPSLIVESKNGYHIYFLVTEASIQNFKTIQTGLIDYYGGDQQCKDISRVLRIPGFYHLKDIQDPFQVKILEDNSKISYTEAEIVELFNISFDEKEKSIPSEYKKHSAPKSFWEYVANIDPKTAMEKLSGTSYVNGEVYEFTTRPSGGYYIIVGGKIANAWITEDGYIGSGTKGGPTIIQWLTYYGYSFSEVANIVRAILPQEIPEEILQGELVDTRESTTGQQVSIRVKDVEDIKTIQDLSDTFIGSHEDNLFFCQDDQMTYVYDEEKHFHQGYTPSAVDEYINNYVIDTLKYTKNVSSTLCKELQRQIKHRARRINYSAVPYISLKDGLLNINTLELELFDKEIFCTIQLNLTYTQLKETEPTRWNQFVDEIIVTKDDVYKTDHDLKEKYLQTLGFLISPVQKPHAFIMFIGEDGRNGKGVAADVLKDIVGHKYISSFSLDKLSNSEHASYGLVGKKINICGEDESVYIKNDILKTLASTDSIEVNPKFRDTFNFVPQVKFVLLSNEYPRFQKLDIAMKRRIHVIPHNRTFTDTEIDWDLGEKLKKERAGILWQIAQAYKRLRDNNFIFQHSKQSELAMFNLEKSVSATVDWFRNCYKVDDIKMADNFYATSDLYTVFQIWCDKVGRNAVSKNRWSKELSNSMSLKSDVKRIGDNPVRGYYLENIEE